jgi:hypothetical protein
MTRMVRIQSASNTSTSRNMSCAAVRGQRPLDESDHELKTHLTLWAVVGLGVFHQKCGRTRKTGQGIGA